MKKIQTMFVRRFNGHEIVEVTPMPAPGMEHIVSGKGTATVKIDGACCAVIGGKLYKRYDAKKGKKPLKGAIPCQEEADPVTGHFPHWVPVSIDDPADKWFWRAYINTLGNGDFRNAMSCLLDGTYEAIGPHFQNNPYNLEKDILVRHGEEVIELPDHSYDTIKKYLENHYIEGIVFWDGGEPVCKIKRSDFSLPWNKK